MFLFSLKNAFRKKLPAILAIFACSIGVGLMSFVFSTTQGIEKKYNAVFSEVATHLVISPKGSFLGFSTGKGTLKKDLIKKIKKIPEVSDYAFSVYVMVPQKAFKTADPFCLLVGVEKEKAIKMKKALRSVYQGRLFEKENEVILGKGLLEEAKMVGNEVKLGDEIVLFSPRGKKISLKVVGFFESGNIMDDYSMFTDIKTARKLSLIPEDEVSSIIVEAKSLDDVEALEKKLKDVLKDDNVDIMSPKEILGNIKKFLDVFTTFRFLISLACGIAGGFSILIVILISVIERKKEFGILKALGWRQRNIIFLVLTESLVLSLLGCTLGIFLGYFGAKIAGKIFPLIKDVALFNLKVLLFSFSFGVLMGVLGGFLPAYFAGKIEPIKVIREP